MKRLDVGEARFFTLEKTMKFAKQKPEATVMDISPTLAKEMLETSPETAVCAVGMLIYWRPA